MPWWAFLLSFTVIGINLLYIQARLRIPIDGAGSLGINGHCEITAVRENSPAGKAGLRAGDIILRIGSSDVKGENHFVMLELFRAGDSTTYDILRDGKITSVRITFASYWSQYPIIFSLMYLLLLIIWAGSLFILYKKPADFTAVLFFIYLQLYVVTQNTRYLFVDDIYASIANAAFVLSFNLFGAVLIHFHMLFPIKARHYSTLRPLLISFYGTGFILGALNAFAVILRNYSASISHYQFYNNTQYWSVTWMGISLIIAFAMAAYQFVSIKDNHYRRQLRLVIIGSFFGLLTPVVFSFYPEFFWQIELEKHLLYVIEFPNILGSFIMIILFFSAIFLYRIWDIEPFIRKAFLYIAATLLILLLYFPLLWFVERATSNRVESLNLVILTILLILFAVFRDFLQNLVDRLFFRRPYDPAIVASRFEEKITGLYAPEDLTRGICQFIKEIFHVESFLFAIKTQDLNYRVIFSNGHQVKVVPKELTIQPETERMLALPRPLASDMVHEMLPLMTLCKGELLVPMQQGKEPFGFMILGRKRSDQSYTLQDVNMIGHLAIRIVAHFHTAALYRRDVDRQVMLEKERIRISEDMHDEIGASLTQISILSEVMKRQSGKPDETQKLIEKISGISGTLVDEMSDIIWAMNPKNDNLASFSYYLRRYASEYLDNTGIRAIFDFPENCPVVRMSSDHRRNLFLVVKEALHNAVKHSGATELAIGLYWADGILKAEIRDNGMGFHTEQSANTGNGLFNMQKRIGNLGGSFNIESKIEGGTRIIVAIPLDTA
ncbi:MAG TPA: histidine kinase [Bacteroidales bacterium]|nr:histidine kinase [Bacteroidales bacterium]HRZ49263.1 histidine kinase [Bacteroidales bacterium]